MTPVTAQDGDLVVCDVQGVFANLRTVPVEDRLRTAMDLVGVEFHDSPFKMRFVRYPVVALCGIGGLPIRIDCGGQARFLGQSLNRDMLGNAMRGMMGAAAQITYLNPRDRTSAEMHELVVEHGHLSVTHTAYLNFAIFGHSSAVECEIDSQRDLVHVARLTVARTHAQDRPPIVVLDERALPAYEATFDMIDNFVDRQPIENLECRNNLWPAAKASMCVVSGTVRNLLRMSRASMDGREREYARICDRISRMLWELFPELGTP